MDVDAFHILSQSVQQDFLGFLGIEGQTKVLEGVWTRKLYMEAQIRDFIDSKADDGNGSLQVLIAAAGYDTLAWRLAEEYPMVNFIEIDHLPHKKRILVDIDVHEIPGDYFWRTFQVGHRPKDVARFF